MPTLPVPWPTWAAGGGQVGPGIGQARPGPLRGEGSPPGPQLGQALVGPPGRQEFRRASMGPDRSAKSGSGFAQNPLTGRSGYRYGSGSSQKHYRRHRWHGRRAPPPSTRAVARSLAGRHRAAPGAMSCSQARRRSSSHGADARATTPYAAARFTTTSPATITVLADAGRYARSASGSRTTGGPTRCSSTAPALDQYLG
jgi:hypothetical protein